MSEATALPTEPNPGKVCYPSQAKQVSICPVHKMCSLLYILFKKVDSRSLFSLFSSVQQLTVKHVHCKILPMTEFELLTSGIWCSCSANWATTTAPLLILTLFDSRCENWKIFFKQQTTPHRPPHLYCAKHNSEQSCSQHFVIVDIWDSMLGI